jgi:hypothetical protein
VQVEAARADPKLYKGRVRVCTACSCVDGTEALPGLLHKIEVPGAHANSLTLVLRAASVLAYHEALLPAAEFA